LRTGAEGKIVAEEMGSRAESMLAQAVEAIVRVDNNLAIQVVKRDDEIDAMDLAIENDGQRVFGSAPNS
jgi:phosphate uptake regulator